MMKIVALMCVYNEELYLPRCLRHLREQGIEVYLIDNGSTDRSPDIARSFLGRGVFHIEQLPRRGMFELELLLRREEAVSAEIGGDWYIHHDADEIRQAPHPFHTLREGIIAADKAGYNAVNFDEFVFVPTATEENFEHDRFVEEMHYYYYFAPASNRRVNAWKNTGQPVDLHSSGGHQVQFPGQRVYPHNFIMRHYMGLSKPHIIKKYCGRVVSEAERTAKGWNNARASLTPDNLQLPSRSRLHRVSSDNTWNRSNPWKQHALFEKTALLPLQVESSKSSGGGGLPPAAFIVGMPHSGGDLLRKLLNRHSELAIIDVPPFLPQLAQVIDNHDSTPQSFVAALREGPVGQSMTMNWGAFQERLASLKSIDLTGGVRTFYKWHAEQQGKHRWGDETPAYVTAMSEIGKIIPEARFIHIVRNGREVAGAMQSAQSAALHIDNIAGQWVWTIAQARRQAQHLRHYLEVHYEQFQQHPGDELRRIITFLELPYEESLLDNFSLTVAGSGMDAHPELSHYDRLRFEAIAAPMLRELGYRLDS